MMASLSCVMSEDQFLCCICLEVFTDPVTTSCGHSFCKTCIDKHWDSSVQYRCPICKEHFRAKPQLKTNTFISEMISQFKRKSQQQSFENLVMQAVGPGDVRCDVCPKARAIKSCLACVASYCQSHLENHLTIPRLQRHQLVEPVENLKDRLCAQHGKTLELFCRDDSKFICLRCTLSDHKNHDTIPLKEEGEVVQANMKKLIKKRQTNIEEIQKSIETSRNCAAREIQNGVKICNVLMECVQRSLNELKQDIMEKCKYEEELATYWIQKLNAEILELTKRKSEMEDVWRSGDSFCFHQTFLSDNPAPVVQDWTEVTPSVPSYEGTVAKAVAKLREILDQEVKGVLKDDLRRVRQFAVEVTLDRDTAHPNLILSYDHKQVYNGDHYRPLPDNPERFMTYTCVAGKHKFSTGRLYFEVHVGEKTGWYMGMAKKSTERKRRFQLTPENGLWLISFKNAECVAHDHTNLILDLKSTPKKIGVFVDYEEGIVSFYNVHTAEMIYSFTSCYFTEDLLPLFNPGTNGANNFHPLVLTSVSAQ
uniref:E3 ubiquitin-protein ligase TRIM39-like n=1 Tax=Neogobius melanostomus TaxID=47308 RepID=A0A8C6UDD4_9GOBI